MNTVLTTNLRSIVEPYAYKYVTDFSGRKVEVVIEHPLDEQLDTLSLFQRSLLDANGLKEINSMRGHVYIVNSKTLYEPLREMLYSIVDLSNSMLNKNVFVMNSMMYRPTNEEFALADKCSMVLIDSYFSDNSLYITEAVRRILDLALTKNCVVLFYTISDYVEEVLFKKLKYSFDKNRLHVLNINNLVSRV